MDHEQAERLIAVLEKIAESLKWIADVPTDEEIMRTE